MREDYPLTRYGFPGVEAEVGLECPNCQKISDARFWGKAAVSWMTRKETFWHEVGIMCPQCNTFFLPYKVMNFQADM